jgi:hypothetical protein
VLVGIPLLWLFSRFLGRVVTKRFTPQSAMIARQGTRSRA